MYTLNGTLTTKPTPVLRPVNILQKTIQTLDTKQCNFYEAFRTSDNSPLIVYPGRQLSATVIRPYIDCSLWERAAASVFKSSVIFMTADKRGVQLDCHALNKRITLFVQWKEVGVQKPDESHFELYLGFLKDGLLKHHFKTIVSQPNKVRKAIFKAIDAISSGLYSCYEIAKGIKIETGFYGGWNILKEDEVRARSVCLEQITTSIYNL